MFLYNYKFIFFLNLFGGMKNARTSIFSLFLYKKNDPVNNKHPKNNLNKILAYDSISSVFATSVTVSGADEGVLSYPYCILLLVRKAIIDICFCFSVWLSLVTASTSA